MNKIAAVVLLALGFLVQSCGNKYNLQLHSPKTIQIHEPLKISVKEKNDYPLDSVQYFINGLPVSASGTVDISGYHLGKQAVSATVYFQGQKKQLNNTVYFLAADAPRVYTYEVLHEYPHDDKAFTQGFVFHNGYFYESTGQRGASSIRKTDIVSGKVLQKKDLDRRYFGEGMTIFRDKVYQLTWQSRIGFVYDLDSFEQESTFDYGQSAEGWGLTHNGEKFLKSDGTESIWFLNPETMKEESHIEAYTNKRKAERLNELEFINGKIYANIWQQNSILIIDPRSGAIEGIANLKGLQARAGQQGEDNVLNGIAYDPVNDRLFVTGKMWNKVFEIRLKEK